MTNLTISQANPPKARAPGIVYLLYFVTAILAVMCAKGIVVRGEAAATMQNILAREFSFRLSITLGLVANALYLLLTILFYQLFRYVSRSLALLAVLFSSVGCTLQIIGTLFQLAPLVLVHDSSTYLRGFSPEQVQGLGLLSLKLYAESFNVAFVFFALFCLLIGYLILVSAFIPRIFGILLVLAGVGWLAYLWPPLGRAVGQYVQPFGFLAELALMLWLLIRGIDTKRWREFVAMKA